jgi:CheY-like chemotaxis protein
MGVDTREAAGSGKRRIMIIEDDPDMIELLSLIVRRGGYQPIAALGGQEGVRRLKEVGADLILLDLMMGDMSGWLVLQAVKGDEALQHIPVLIVSAKHQMEDAGQAQAFAHLFEGYLVKPFVVQDLMSQITEALA